MNESVVIPSFFKILGGLVVIKNSLNGPMGGFVIIPQFFEFVDLLSFHELADHGWICYHSAILRMFSHPRFCKNK